MLCEYPHCSLVELFSCIAGTVEDSSSVLSYRIIRKVKFLLQICEISRLISAIITRTKYH